MNAFTRMISRSFEGALKALERFPAAIGCALAFAVVTLFKIQLDTTEPEFLLSCLSWAFAFGAVFSLAAITLAQSRFGSKKAFTGANCIGILAAAAVFLLLYFFAGTDLEAITVISNLAEARVSAGIFVSGFAFIVLAAYPKAESDFAKAFFMTHKAFFISLLYGLVMLAGAAGVAGAVEALLYNDMSPKVYSYLATVSGFLAFMIFLGYFPDFRKGQKDEHREVAQDQPRFIEILFSYIMVPLVLALTLVLLIWAAKTILSGMNASFTRLSGIAAAYTLGGLWLHIMVTHHKTTLAKWYRLIYPIAALVILIFEGWALMLQLQNLGLKTDEYFFILIWLLAATSAVLLLIIKAKAYLPMVALLCALAVIAVLPVIGYQALPVTTQIHRLEKLLVNEDMLENDRLTPATGEPEREVREKITDAVFYLTNVEGAKLPSWLDSDFGNADVFKEEFGFDQIWPEDDSDGVSYFELSTYLPSSSLDISDYRWAVTISSFDTAGTNPVTCQGEKGIYQIDWSVSQKTGIPTLKILLNGDTIYEEELSAYLEEMKAKYPGEQVSSEKIKAEDMYLPIETPEVKVLLVFSYLDAYNDPYGESSYNTMTLNTLYLKEKE